MTTAHASADGAGLGPAARSRRASAGRYLPLLLLMPSLVLLFALLVVPLGIVALSSLQPNVLLSFAGPGLDNYAYLLSKSYYVDVIVRTARLALVTTAIAIPVGFVAALLIARLGDGVRSMTLMALAFPVLTGPLAIVLGWMALLTDGGPLFGPLIALGLIPPPKLLGTETAVVISLVQFVLPFAILTLYTAVSRIPAELYEAVTSLGGGRLARLVHVSLPLGLPGLLSASIICFSLAASSYVSPYYLGGAGQQTLTTLVAQFILATYNSQLAGAAAMLLLVLMLGSIVAITAALGRSPPVTARAAAASGAAFLLALYLFVLAPILFIVVMAFNKATSFPAPFEGVTLGWFAAILHQPGFLEATRRSVVVALLASLLACTVSFLAGYALGRLSRRMSGIVTLVLTAPLLVPQIVMGLAMLQLAEFLGFGTSLAGLVGVHAVYVMPFALRLVLTGLAGLDGALEEASRSLGAGSLDTWREVTLPLLRPSLVAAFSFCFMLSFVNLPLSMFLVNPQTATLPTVMFSYIESRVDPMIAALATLIIIAAAGTTFVLEKWLKIRLMG